MLKISVNYLKKVVWGDFSVVSPNFSRYHEIKRSLATNFAIKLIRHGYSID